MKQMKKRGAKKTRLTAQEKALEKDPNWEPVTADRLTQLQSEFQTAKDENKSERASVRINAMDLELLKKRADEKGLGYQTLLGSIIHLYVTDRLVEIDQAKLALDAMIRNSKNKGA